MIQQIHIQNEAEEYKTKQPLQMDIRTKQQTETTTEHITRDENITKQNAMKRNICWTLVNKKLSLLRYCFHSKEIPSFNQFN